MTYVPATGTVPSTTSVPVTRLCFHFAVNSALVSVAWALLTTIVTSAARGVAGRSVTVTCAV